MSLLSIFKHHNIDLFEKLSPNEDKENSFVIEINNIDFSINVIRRSYGQIEINVFSELSSFKKTYTISYPMKTHCYFDINVDNKNFKGVAAMAQMNILIAETFEELTNLDSFEYSMKANYESFTEELDRVNEEEDKREKKEMEERKAIFVQTGQSFLNKKEINEFIKSVRERANHNNKRSGIIFEAIDKDYNPLYICVASYKDKLYYSSDPINIDKLRKLDFYHKHNTPIRELKVKLEQVIKVYEEV